MGLGYLPLAPGTFGAFGGLVSGWLLMQYSAYPNLYLIILIILFLLLGVYCSNKIIPEWGKDPSRIVIDETVGMWLSMLFIPNVWYLLVLSFMLFRFFDIKKPFYIKQFEKFSGGWGIMLDDVVAGLYANLVMQLIIIVFAYF